MPDALKTLCAAELSDSLREISNGFNLPLLYLFILGEIAVFLLICFSEFSYFYMFNLNIITYMLSYRAKSDSLFFILTFKKFVSVCKFTIIYISFVELIPAAPYDIQPNSYLFFIDATHYIFVFDGNMIPSFHFRRISFCSLGMRRC